MIELANSSRVIIRKDKSTCTKTMKKVMNNGNRELIRVPECIVTDGSVTAPGVIIKGNPH